MGGLRHDKEHVPPPALALARVAGPRSSFILCVKARKYALAAWKSTELDGRSHGRPRMSLGASCCRCQARCRAVVESDNFIRWTDHRTAARLRKRGRRANEQRGPECQEGAADQITQNRPPSSLSAPRYINEDAPSWKNAMSTAGTDAPSFLDPQERYRAPTLKGQLGPATGHGRIFCRWGRIGSTVP